MAGDDTAQPAAKKQKIAKDDEPLESRISSLEKKSDDTVKTEGPGEVTMLADCTERTTYLVDV